MLLRRPILVLASRKREDTEECGIKVYADGSAVEDLSEPASD